MRTRMSGIVGIGVCLWIGLSGAAPAASTTLPLCEPFDSAPLGAAWSVDASGTSTLDVRNGCLEIVADANTFAHVERPLGIDRVRVACDVYPTPGVTWAPSIFLYWDAENWLQLAVIYIGGASFYGPTDGGEFYFSQCVAGKWSEGRTSILKGGRWQSLAIELGFDGIRLLSSMDRQLWVPVQVMRRPPELSGPPALLILGKGHGGDAPDLDNDFPERGGRTVAKFRNLTVEATSPERLRLSALELAELAEPGRDWLSETERSAFGDPTFESVARHFPEMRVSRELIGVKDHPREIGVAHDGSLEVAGPPNTIDFEKWTGNAFFELGEPPARFGADRERVAKRLHKGYVPIVAATYEHEDLAYEQTVFGYSEGMSPDADLYAYVRLRLANPTSAKKHAPVGFRGPSGKIDARWALGLDAGASAEVYLKILNAETTQTVSQVTAEEFDSRCAESAQYWEALLGKGMQIDVPESRVNEAWRAWLAYSFLDVDKRGQVYEPHDGSGYYEAIFGYSAALYCCALDWAGFHDEARVYLDSLQTFISPEGAFIVNYGLPDTGALLYAMAEHYRVTSDDAWLRRVAPAMVRMSDWIAAKRCESIAAQEGDPIWRGLIKMQPYCDHPDPAYSYLSDVYLCAGMEAAAEALGALDASKDAERIAREAAAYRRDVLASMQRAVVRREGQQPILPIFPETHGLLKAVNCRPVDYWGLVASMVLETGFLDPRDPRTDWLVDPMRLDGGMILENNIFAAGIDHAYSYGYLMTCLKRGEAERAVLGFYAWLAYGMSRGTYSPAEVVLVREGQHFNTAPHLYSCAQQLRLVRNMLVCEEGNTLVLAQATPRHWLRPGQEIAVRNAPTRFGPTSYTIRSDSEGRRATVTIEPPRRNPPESIRLHLRHPLEKRIESVRCEGLGPVDFTGETMLLKSPTQKVTLQVAFEP